LAFHQNLRLGTASGARPARTLLESRASASETSAMIDFVRCGALQSHVGTVSVVPANGTLQIEMERPTSQRHRGQGTRALLQGADEAFHDGNTAPLADGAETLTDGVAATPLFEAVTTELLAPVGNQMPGRCTDVGNDLAEKPSDLLRSGLAQEKPEAQDRSRIMI
jgi:hypothetical protein